MRSSFLRGLLLGVWVLCSTAVLGQEEASGISAEEAGWLLTNPDVMVDLSQLPPDQLLKFMEVYQNLAPEDQQKLRDNAGEFQGLSPDEQAWAMQNPDAVRQLGNLSEAERKQLLDLYRNADPATQRRLRNTKP